MDRETMNKMRIQKNKIKTILNRRNEFIVDKIFQGNMYVAGTVELIEKMSTDYCFNTQIAIFEGSRIGLNFKNKEFHTLHFSEKNENLKNFIMSCGDSFDNGKEKYDKLVGIILYEDKVTDSFGMVAVGFGEEEFSRENVKKTLENVFPKAEDIFNAVAKDSMIHSAKLLMLEELLYLQRKNKS